MKSSAIWKKTNFLAGGRRKKRGKQDRSQVSLGIVSMRKKYKVRFLNARGSLTEMDKEVSDNTMDSTIANVKEGYEFYSNLKQMLPYNYRDLGSLCRRGAACTKVC
ncbi:hypothetical protein H0E87_021739 [Populus deltoides]|uniref:Uncharacterized protein n=1 Tax=Populus deltoides TaxID=3696 RepID=A0A8T2XGH9_POPDE|nr:hypothetical protein H0E87_021739 [Populus deltoides]